MISITDIDKESASDAPAIFRRDCIIVSVSNINTLTTPTPHRHSCTPSTSKTPNIHHRPRCYSLVHTFHTCRISTTPPTRRFDHHHCVSVLRMQVEVYSTSTWPRSKTRKTHHNRNASTRPIQCCRPETQRRRGGEICSSSASRPIERTRSGSREVNRYAKG